jgi:hypothetical protein
MFEQIDAEITDERKSALEAPPAKPPSTVGLADQIRHELALIEARCSRLVAS